MKQCKGLCGIIKEESEFRIRKIKNKNGEERTRVAGICKICERQCGREYDKIRNKTEKRKEQNRVRGKSDKRKEYDRARNKTEKRKERDRARNKTEKRKERDRIRGKAPRGRYKTYRHSAKQKNLTFNISFEQFDDITRKPCIYCDGFSPEKQYCGIDRSDNSIGYEADNIVPCCVTCNMMKNSHSIDFFIKHIVKILRCSEAGNFIIAEEKTSDATRDLQLEQGLKDRFSHYRSRSKRRGLVFDLTLEQFYEITSQSCVYCNCFSLEKDYCGIDRADNKKGYEIGNVVSCCRTCNTIKLNHSVDFMIQHIIKILNHLNKI